MFPLAFVPLKAPFLYWRSPSSKLGKSVLHGVKDSAARFDHPDTVMCVAWRPDGERLATGCNDGPSRGAEASAARRHTRSPGGGFLMFFSLITGTDGTSRGASQASDLNPRSGRSVSLVHDAALGSVNL